MKQQQAKLLATEGHQVGAQFKNIAKLGKHMGHCLRCVSNESCCLITAPFDFAS